MNDHYYPPTVHRPSFSATSSSSSTFSIPSPNSPTQPLSIPTCSMPAFQFSGAAAPLPSPTSEQQHQFFDPPPAQRQHFNTPFGSPIESHMPQQSHNQDQPRYNLRSQAQRQRQQEPKFTSPFAQSAQQQAQPVQRFPQQAYHQAYENPMPSRQSSTDSTNSEASLHLRDFSLLAEAAKRAQMHCVTRDLEEMEF